MKKFIFKIIMFCAIIFCGQFFLYTAAHYSHIAEPATPHNIQLFNEYIDANADIIYFGDSVLFMGGEADPEQKSVPDLLQNILPEYSVKSIYHPAYNPDIYLEYCKYMIRRAYQPQMVIIPINLRSFSPVWDKQPGYQFEKEKIFLQSNNSVFLQMFYLPLSVFKLFYPRIAEHDFINTTVFDGQKRVGKIKNYDNPGYKTWSAEKMKNKLILNYMYVLSPGHRKLHAITKIATILKEHDIKFLFYITPLDYETAEQYLGERFGERITHNASVIKQVLAKQHVEILDLTLTLPAASFDWKQHLYPNEHLNMQGKQFLAQTLARNIKP